MQNRKKTTLLILTLLIIALLSILICSCSLKSSSSPAKYTRGKITETGFESKWLNLRWSLPDGITMATEDELDSLVDSSMEIMVDENKQKALDRSKTNLVYEMAAVDLNNASSLLIITEKLALKNITMETYIENCRELLKDTNLEIHFPYDITTEEIVGEEYSKLTCVFLVDGLTIIQDQFLRKQGDRMIVISITYNEDTVHIRDALMNAFTVY